MFDEGLEIVRNKMVISHRIQKKIAANLLKTPNVYYRSTIMDGINGFFKLYTPQFSAHEIHITADYPTLAARPELDGIEFIEKYLRYILLVAVPIIAVMILRKKDFGEEVEFEPPLAKSIVLSAVIGFVIGAYDGFFGPGTGTFLTLLFNSVLGLNIICACGTTKIVNLSANISAMATYALSGNVLFGVGIKCAIFSVLGNWMGSGLALKKGAKVVRPVMIIVMVILLGKIAIEMF